MVWEKKNAKHDAITVVSPMRDGDDEKNQDRARWFGPLQIAALADGLSSSPYSDLAAELAVKFTPALFHGGKPSQRLRFLADLLTTQRLEAQGTGVNVAGDATDSMKSLLQEAARGRLANAYQTTLVAVCLTPTDQGVIADVIRCGDSGFFAFSGTGHLLALSPARSKESRTPKEESSQFDQGILRFGPGDQLLVKAEGSLKDIPEYCDDAVIGQLHASNWIVCQPIDQVDRTSRSDVRDKYVVTKNDRLLVPRYLLGNALAGANDYRQIRFHRAVRRVGDRRPTALTDARVATEALPDHVDGTGVEYFRELYPSDAHFLLASDGLFEAFDTAEELWSWLNANQSELEEPDRQTHLVEALHNRLRASKGDDDISFVWIRPTPMKQRNASPVGLET